MTVYQISDLMLVGHDIFFRKSCFYKTDVVILIVENNFYHAFTSEEAVCCLIGF